MKSNMKHDDQLKLQAWLDGELPAREAAEVQAGLAATADGRALLAELRNTTAAFSGHEAGVTLPESREFFWSKIERQIAREAAAIDRPAPGLSWLARLRRQLIPLTGFATVTVVCGVVTLHSLTGTDPVAEMELANEDIGACTYHDQANKMTVVWFSDRSSATEAAPDAEILPAMAVESVAAPDGTPDAK